jgi:excisionase family DNA binding protein
MDEQEIWDRAQMRIASAKKRDEERKQEEEERKIREAEEQKREEEEITSKDYLTSTETCERLGISYTTLMRYVRSGHLKQHKQPLGGHTYYYKSADVLALKQSKGTMQPRGEH